MPDSRRGCITTPDASQDGMAAILAPQPLAIRPGRTYAYRSLTGSRAREPPADRVKAPPAAVERRGGADGSGMGVMVGAENDVPTTGRRVWWSRVRRLASAIIAMIAVVLAGSDAVGATS